MALTFLSIIGCQKDSDNFVPHNSSTVQTDIFGIVTDTNDEPIADALIKCNGKTTQSDQYGIYRLSDVTTDTKHNFLSITKDGYFKGNRVFRSSHKKELTLKTQLVSQNFDLSFNASSGGNVSKDKITLTFEPGSVMVEESKADYNGSVTVAMHYMDPTELDTYEQMPGDLSATDLNSNIVTLQSFGMVYVELKSQSGDQLQIKTGKEVTMTADLPSAILSKASNEIPMWHFDNETGLWKEEGKANLINNQYVAKVSHFSCWNYDAPYPSIILSGRVVDANNNPLPGLHVWVSVLTEYGGGHGGTDTDGTFSGRVTKDQILSFKVLDANCGLATPIYETEIGPFSVDTDLGDIVVAISDGDYLQVNADFIDCDGNAIVEGFVTLGPSYYSIIDGSIDISIPICPTIDYSLVATDQIGLQSIDPIALETPGTNDLGTVSVCGIDIDYIKVNCPDLGIAVTLTDSIALSLNGTSKYLEGFSYQQNLYNSIGLSYSDNSSTEFEEGTFNLTTPFNFDNGANGASIFDLVSGTITITQGGTNGSVIIGNYNLIAKDIGTELEHNFTGSFRYTYY